MQCAKAPAWIGFTEDQNKLNLSLDAYLDAAENKYRWHIQHESWAYKESDTSVIPKKSLPEVNDDTIAMPAIQHSQTNIAHKLSPHAKAMSGSKPPPQGIIKKKKKLVKFQKPYLQRSTPPPVEPQGRHNSPFTTNQTWLDFLRGKFPYHSKSENSFNISGVNWYWCNTCRSYNKDRNTRLNSPGVNYKQNNKPQVAAAPTVSQKDESLPARANVASVPATPPTPYIKEIDEIPPAVGKYYDFDTEEEV